MLTVVGGETRGLLSRLRVTSVIMLRSSRGNDEMQLQLTSRYSSRRYVISVIASDYVKFFLWLILEESRPVQVVDIGVYIVSFIVKMKCRVGCCLEIYTNHSSTTLQIVWCSNGLCEFLISSRS